MSKVTNQTPTFQHDGETFRDLDHDGVLAPFEDWRLSPSERATDLVSRLTTEEKVGLLLHGTLQATGPWGIAGHGEDYDLEKYDDLIARRFISAAISRLSIAPRELARRHNELQRIAAATRFSIPLSISTDPRNHFAELVGVSNQSEGFTKFPEFLGVGATNDPTLARAVGDVVRREYRAVGFHVALSPQADLATEPRWSRALGTFGANPARVSALAGAYVAGAQGGESGLHDESIACVVKHWVGYGASRDGFDGHNYYGRFTAFPAGRFQDHVDAFAGVFAVKVAGVMPTYTIAEGLVVDGEPVEPVGGGYSKVLLTDLLRNKIGYEGMILSDWAITKNANSATLTGVPAQGPQDIAMPWGVEDLSRPERYAKLMNAGIDQIGGEDDPQPMLDAIEQGLVSMARIDDAARRVLEQKFALGLFENPFVDEALVDAVVGCAEHVALAQRVQRASLVALGGDDVSLRSGDRVYAPDLDAAVLSARGFTPVTEPSDATVAVLRMHTPFEILHPNFFFGSMMHEGSLEFQSDDPQVVRLREVAAQVPTIAVIFCDRPPTVGLVDELASRLVAEYGVSDDVIVDALRDDEQLTGVAPMTRPLSMAEVESHPGDQHDGWALS